MLRTGRTTIVMGALRGRNGFLSIDIPPGGKHCSDDVTLHFASLGLKLISMDLMKHDNPIARSCCYPASIFCWHAR